MPPLPNDYIECYAQHFYELAYDNDNSWNGLTEAQKGPWQRLADKLVRPDTFVDLDGDNTDDWKDYTFNGPPAGTVVKFTPFLELTPFYAAWLPPPTDEETDWRDEVFFFVTDHAAQKAVAEWEKAENDALAEHDDDDEDETAA